MPTNIIATFNFQKRYNPFPLVGIKNSADSFVFGIGASQALPVLEVEADPKCSVSTQLQTRCFDGEFYRCLETTVIFEIHGTEARLSERNAMSWQNSECEILWAANLVRRLVHSRY